MNEITDRQTNQNRADDSEWQANFAALEKSLRSKRESDSRVVTESDKYGNDPA